MTYNFPPNPKVTQLLDANGNVLLGGGSTASAVNSVTVRNRGTGVNPGLEAGGSDTNIGLLLSPKGTGAIQIWVTSGNTPILAAQGADASHNLNLTAKGSGVVQAGGNQVGTWSKVTLTTASTLGAVSGHRYVVLLGTGAAPTLPTAVGNNALYELKNIAGSVISVATTSSQTVESSTLKVPAGASVTVVSDGANWRLLNASWRKSITCWGDSLTYSFLSGGGQASPTWPQTMANDLGATAYNGGQGSHGSAEIAVRQGGLRPLVTLTGNQIPSGSVTPIAVSAISPTDGWRVAASSGTFLDMHGTLAGVAGKLRHDLTTVTDFFFVPDAAPASTVAVAADTPFIGDEGVGKRDQIAIIWAGTNNSTQPSAVARDVASMVEWLAPGTNFLVVSNTRDAAAADPINDLLVAEYGENYADLRGYLIASGLAAAGIAPTGTDATDIAAGNVPTSLKSDGLHFVQAAYTVIGHWFANLLTDKGWA